MKKIKNLLRLVFKLKSLPAALYNSLGGFAVNNVNLTKLESFTVNNSFDQALFYLDIEGHAKEPKVETALETFKKNTESLDILEFIWPLIIEIIISHRSNPVDFNLSCYIAMGIGNRWMLR